MTSAQSFERGGKMRHAARCDLALAAVGLGDLDRVRRLEISMQIVERDDGGWSRPEVSLPGSAPRTLCATNGLSLCGIIESSRSSIAHTVLSAG
jgi:hypothetical protein